MDHLSHVKSLALGCDGFHENLICEIRSELRADGTKRRDSVTRWLSIADVSHAGTMVFGEKDDSAPQVSESGSSSPHRAPESGRQGREQIAPWSTLDPRVQEDRQAGYLWKPQLHADIDHAKR